MKQCNHDNSQKINGQCLQCSFFPEQKNSLKINQPLLKKEPKNMHHEELEDERDFEFEESLYMEVRANKARIRVQFQEICAYGTALFVLSCLCGLLYFL